MENRWKKTDERNVLEVKEKSGRNLSVLPAFRTYEVCETRIFYKTWRSQ